MALVEVLYKVEDSTGKGELPWQDGMPIITKPPGVWIAPEEFALWLKDGTAPASFLALPPCCREPHEVFVARMTAALNGVDVLQVAKEMEVERAQAAAHIDEFKRVKELVQTFGYDTNWGFSDLRVHSVMIADLNFQDVQEILATPRDPSRPLFAPTEPLHRRAYRVPYEKLLSDDSVEKVRSKSHYVKPPRGKPSMTPFALDTLVEVIDANHAH